MVAQKAVLKPLTVPSDDRVVRAAFRVKPDGLVVVAGVDRERHVFDIDLHNWALYTDHVAPHCEGITDRDAVTLTYLLYQYTLRTANTKNMRKWTGVAKEAITAARESLFSHAHLTQYKMATLRCVVHRLHPATDIAEIARHFEAVGLRAEDAVLFAMLHFNGDIAAFVELVRAIPETTFTLEPHALRREIERSPTTLRELNKTAGYFTHRKLKFIVTGNRLRFSDIHNDLLLRGVAAYYWVRPFYSVEHAVNYAKQAIYKHAMNLIAYYNDPCRARTHQVGDTGTFNNTVIQFSEYLPGAVVASVNHTEDAMIEALDAARYEHA